MESDGMSPKVREGFTKTVSRLDNTLRTLVEYAGIRDNTSGSDVVGLYELVADCVEKLNYHWNYDQTSFSIQIDRKIIVTGDIIYLNPLVLNLLINALTFRHEKRSPEIQLSAQLGEDSLSLSIADNGVGMTQDVKDRAFEMFFRGSVLSQGAGLGLFIVKETVTKLKGDIRVESNPGEGTKFIMKLPLTSEELTFAQT